MTSLTESRCVQLLELLHEPGQGKLAIPVLRALFHCCGFGAGWQMNHPYGRFRFVYVLPTGATGAHGLPADIFRIEAHLIHGLDSIDSNKPILSLVLRTEWTPSRPLYGSNQDAANEFSAAPPEIEINAECAVPASDPGSISTVLNSIETARASFGFAPAL